MPKVFKILISVLIALAVSFAASQIKIAKSPLNLKTTPFKNNESFNNPTERTNDNKTGLPNPAAIYCEEMGYTYKIEKTPAGEEGKCVAGPGAEFKAWDFIKGKAGKKYSYCVKKGYGIETKKEYPGKYSAEYAVCVQAGEKRTPMIELMEEERRPSINAEPQTTEKEKVQKEKKEISSGIKSNDFQEDLIGPENLGTPPSSFDWRNYNGEDWVTSVKDQAQCGSCWAFSAVGAVESKLNIDYSDSTLDYDLSEQHLVSCDCPGDCNGGWQSDALGYIRDAGVADEDCFGYLGCEKWRTSPSYVCAQEYPCDLCSDWQDGAAYITNYHHITNTQAAYKQALADYGPLSIAVDATNWSSYTGGIFVGSVIQANHAVVLVGYNDAESCWIIKNSWGSSWGESGYIRLSYTNNPITTFDEAYAIEQTLKPITRGTLQPYVINMPSEVMKNEFFTVETGVRCIDGSCGDVSAALTLPPTQPTTCSETWDGDCAEGPPETFDNTFDDCSIGAGADESIDEVRLDKIEMNFGEEIEVTCDVIIKSLSCGQGWTGDNLYIYYRNSPTGTWQKKYDVSQVYSCFNYSVKFIPDNLEGEHQVRCIAGWNVPESECGSGSYYDNDDANFFVYGNTSGKGIIPTDYGSPFYTTSDNPQACSNMQDQDACEQIWTVKATGDIDSSWLLYTIYNSNYKVIQTKETDKTNVTIKSPAVVSISVTDGAVDFGTAALGATMDNSGDVQTISVDGGPADLEVRSTDFSDGTNSWTLGNASDDNQVKWEFSPDNSAWIIFSAPDTLYNLADDIANGGFQDLHLRITMPAASASSNQYSSTITIVATAP